MPCEDEDANTKFGAGEKQSIPRVWMGCVWKRKSMKQQKVPRYMYMYLSLKDALRLSGIKYALHLIYGYFEKVVSYIMYSAVLQSGHLPGTCILLPLLRLLCLLYLLWPLFF